MHGVPVFQATRVPVQTLFEYLEGGESLEEFLKGFPTVSRALAIAALEEAERLLLAREVAKPEAVLAERKASYRSRTTISKVPTAE
jgi:uncharacterized protein (DUF433 family)